VQILLTGYCLWNILFIELKAINGFAHRIKFIFFYFAVDKRTKLSDIKFHLMLTTMTHASTERDQL